MPLKITKKTTFIAISTILLMTGILFLVADRVEAPMSSNSIVNQASQNLPSKSEAQFDKSQYSVDLASSLWAVINKDRILPADYIPAELVTPNVPLRLGASAEEMHLRSDAAGALERMAEGAKANGAQLMIASGYRSYSTQKYLYNYYVGRDGVEQTDKVSARPGHSEHQSGLSVDLEPVNRQCEVQVCFATTTEGKWLAANAPKYGFIIRYPAGKTNLTGYSYEPWHVRYVGVGLAIELEKNQAVMEQFFGLEPALQYSTEPFRLKSVL